MSGALEWLARVADPRWVSMESGQTASVLRARAHLPLPDGEEVAFALRVELVPGDPLPHVWEDGSSRLPRGCPARHFFEDGSFCMGLTPDGPPTPADEPSARRWWATLHGYLELQLIAELTGEWPERHARAHGFGAAIEEAIAESWEAMLPKIIVDKVRRGTLRMSTRPGKLTGRQRPCPCGSGVPLMRCHEAMIVLLLTARAKRSEMEQVFWSMHAGKACCGTMRCCPLREGRSKRVREDS